MPALVLPAVSPDAFDTARRRDRLVRAAIGAVDPFARPPLTGAPAYAASTGYLLGSVVASNGNWYVAVSAGTSPASPTSPAHVNGSAVSDGSVLWTYLGPAAAIAADPTAPTVTVSASAPALGNVHTPPVSGGGGAVVANGGYAYNYGGYPGLYTFNRAAGQPFGQFASWEFETDDAQLAIGIFGRSAPVQLVIDGRRYAPGGLAMPTTGENWITIAFPQDERAAHRVRVELGNGAMALKDVRVSSVGQVWAPARRGPRAVFIADSILSGSGFGPWIAGGSAGQRIAGALGWADAWDFSIGGTGYIAQGSGFYTYGQRVSEALTLDPDIWVLMGSTNDSGQPVATITAAVLATLRAIRAGSRTPIVVLGVWPANAAAAVTEAAVAAAVTQLADAATIFVPIATDTVPWVTGSWNNAARPGSANAALVIGGDGIHPVDGGTAYLARRAAAAIKRLVLPKLAG